MFSRAICLCDCYIKYSIKKNQETVPILYLSIIPSVYGNDIRLEASRETFVKV